MREHLKPITKILKTHSLNSFSISTMAMENWKRKQNLFIGDKFYFLESQNLFLQVLQRFENLEIVSGELKK